jgi:hypothetical protein
MGRAGSPGGCRKLLRQLTRTLPTGYSMGLWSFTNVTWGGQAAQGELEAAQAADKDPAKFSGKKSKAAAKKGAGSTQWEILKMSGIPESEISAFRCGSTDKSLLTRVITCF